LDLNDENTNLEEDIVNLDTLSSITVTEKDVGDILSTINQNKAYGPDGISPRLLKEGGPSIVKVLTRLFNRSLELAKFPLTWKRANVLPIYNKTVRNGDILLPVLE
jgi:hypothetical protein